MCILKNAAKNTVHKAILLVHWIQHHRCAGAILNTKVTQTNRYIFTDIVNFFHIKLKTMLKLPPLPALRAFEAVARLGSVTRAAEELHVTHSAVSHQVRQLEEYLGIALIDRSARRMHLTPDGRVYAYQIRQSLQQIGGMTERITQRAQSEHLTIAVLPSFATHWLIPRLPSFWQEYPDWQIELVAGLDMTDFDQSPVDCAIRFGEVSMHGLRSELMMGEWQLLVAAAHNPNYYFDQSAQEAFAQGTALLVNEDVSSWSIAAGIDNPTPHEPLVVNDSNVALEAVRMGVIGCTLMRWSIAAHWVQQGLLKQVTPHMAQHVSAYHLVWPNRSHDSAKLNVFKGWLKQQCTQFEQHTLSGHTAYASDQSLPFKSMKANKLNLSLDSIASEKA